MGYIENMGMRARKILKEGDVLCLGCYSYPNGARWIARYKNKYYKMIHDGTGNDYFCDKEPHEISEEEAMKRVIKADAYEEAREVFGWGEATDEILGL